MGRPGYGYALFDTPIGRCGIAWAARGIAGLQLPEKSDTATRARLAGRFPDAAEASPPRDVRRAIDGITTLLRGRASDLSAIPLDMEGVAPFRRSVYEAARAVPPGTTISYGELAARLGTPGAARAVGQALARNPFAIVVPCHRVLAAGGRVGGFTADGGVATKLRLLALEAPPAGAPGFDPALASAHLRAADPALGRLIDRVGPLRMELKTTESVFGALAEAIVYQQLNGRAAATIFGRVRALFPRSKKGPTPRDILGASDDDLRGAGLSRAKLRALRDLAERTRSGEIPDLEELRTMDDDAIVESLTRVRGIGRWTVEMLLMFRLGRPDVLPVDDYGVRKGFAVAFRKRELPSRSDLQRRGARWAPYRSAASWYLWRAADLGRG